LIRYTLVDDNTLSTQLPDTTPLPKMEPKENKSKRANGEDPDEKPASNKVKSDTFVSGNTTSTGDKPDISNNTKGAKKTVSFGGVHVFDLVKEIEDLAAKQKDVGAIRTRVSNAKVATKGSIPTSTNGTSSLKKAALANHIKNAMGTEEKRAVKSKPPTSPRYGKRINEKFRSHEELRSGNKSSIRQLKASKDKQRNIINTRRGLFDDDL